MFSVPKKQKLNKDSGRMFQEQWTTEFGVIEKNNKALCCLCSGTVVSRTFNVNVSPTLCLEQVEVSIYGDVS
jgi:hypothetical protein